MSYAFAPAGFEVSLSRELEAYLQRLEQIALHHRVARMLDLVFQRAVLEFRHRIRSIAKKIGQKLEGLCRGCERILLSYGVATVDVFYTFDAFRFEITELQVIPFTDSPSPESETDAPGSTAIARCGTICDFDASLGGTRLAVSDRLLVLSPADRVASARLIAHLHLAPAAVRPFLVLDKARDEARLAYWSARYVKSTITRSTQTDGAILMLFAAGGPMPQTREHILLARQIGVPALVVFLNNLADSKLVELVELEMRGLLSSYGFSGDDIPIIQGSTVCALEGKQPEIGEEAVIKLMAAVDGYIPQPERMVDRPFLMPIEDMFSTSSRGTVVTGRVERGIVNVGDEVEIVGIKNTLKTIVTGVEMFRKALDRGEAGDNIGALLRSTKGNDVGLQQATIASDDAAFQHQTGVLVTGKHMSNGLVISVTVIAATLDLAAGDTRAYTVASTESATMSDIAHSRQAFLALAGDRMLDADDLSLIVTADLATGSRPYADASRERCQHTMEDHGSNELLDAALTTSLWLKRHEDTHRMAETNKAFSHYRW